MVKRSRVKFTKQFLFKLTEEMHAGIHQVARLADDDAAEVVRRMIRREMPFFMEYASQTGELPNGDTRIRPNEAGQ